MAPHHLEGSSFISGSSFLYWIHHRKGSTRRPAACQITSGITIHTDNHLDVHYQSAEVGDRADGELEREWSIHTASRLRHDGLTCGPDHAVSNSDVHRINLHLPHDGGRLQAPNLHTSQFGYQYQSRSTAKRSLERGASDMSWSAPVYTNASARDGAQIMLQPERIPRPFSSIIFSRSGSTPSNDIHW